MLLFVGKGSCLRSAILAHFADERSARREHKLKDEVRSIEWTETAGELGALLRELHGHQGPRAEDTTAVPIRAAAACTLKVSAASGAVQMLAIDETEPGELEKCFGVFHSRKDARKALADIAKAKQLCLKVLGLEQSEGSCLAHQLGHCKGACVGKEPLMLHAVRVQMALSSLKFKAWPFPGPCGAHRARSPWARSIRMCWITGRISAPRVARRSWPRSRAAPLHCAFDPTGLPDSGALPCESYEARMAGSRSRLASRQRRCALTAARERQRPLLDRDGAGGRLVGARRGARGVRRRRHPRAQP